MLRLDQISVWKFLADGKLNSALYTAVESGLDWSLMRFVMSNYKHPLVRGFICSRLFYSEKAIGILLDNLQGKTKEVRRFLLNTRYERETREFLLKNLSDPRVQRFLLEIWEEKDISWLVLGNLVPEGYQNFDPEAVQQFVLANLDNESVRTSVVAHLDVEAVRCLLLDNLLDDETVETFMAECLHEEELQRFVLDYLKGNSYDYYDRREYRQSLVVQFLLNNLGVEAVRQFIIDYLVMEQFDERCAEKQLIQQFVLDNIRNESVRQFLLECLDKKAVQQFVLDNHLANRDIYELVLDNINEESVAKFVVDNFDDKDIHCFVNANLYKEAVKVFVVDNLHNSSIARFASGEIWTLTAVLRDNLDQEHVVKFLIDSVHLPEGEHFVLKHIEHMLPHLKASLKDTSFASYGPNYLRRSDRVFMFCQKYSGQPSVNQAN